MNCNLSGSSVHGIFQAIVLEWTAISFSSGSSRPRDWTVRVNVLKYPDMGTLLCVCHLSRPGLHQRILTAETTKSKREGHLQGATWAWVIFFSMAHFQFYSTSWLCWPSCHVLLHIYMKNEEVRVKVSVLGNNELYMESHWHQGQLTTVETLRFFPMCFLF